MKTEILWSLLKNTVPQTGDPWIVAGDFNSSPTFDWMWGPKPRGNQEFIKRMNDVGLTDCLSDYVGELVPTFQNSSDKRILHQHRAKASCSKPSSSDAPESF